MKRLIVIVVALAMTALPTFAAAQKATLINSNGDKVVVAAGSAEAQKYFGRGYTLMGASDVVCDCSEELGGFYSPDIMGLRARTKTIAGKSTTATTTLRLVDSGTTYLLSGSGTPITLPTVNRAGTWFRFIVAGALDSASTTIESAAGDDIEGSIMVAGAVVDCNASDYVRIAGDKENIGDYFEIMSTGTYWVPLSSGILTASAGVCEG